MLASCPPPSVLAYSLVRFFADIHLFLVHLLLLPPLFFLFPFRFPFFSIFQRLGQRQQRVKVHWLREAGLDWLGQHIPAQRGTRPSSLVSHTLATALGGRGSSSLKANLNYSKEVLSSCIIRVCVEFRRRFQVFLHLRNLFTNHPHAKHLLFFSSVRNRQPGLQSKRTRFICLPLFVWCDVYKCYESAFANRPLHLRPYFSWLDHIVFFGFDRFSSEVNQIGRRKSGTRNPHHYLIQHGIPNMGKS